MTKLILRLISFVLMSVLVVVVVFGLLKEFRVVEFAAVLSRALSGDWKAILGLLLAALFVFLVLVLSVNPRRRSSWDDNDSGV